jgi:hypothetical protein
MKAWIERAALLLAFLSVYSAQLLTCFAQGSLTPPGAPAPTMKSLAQIEPRTPVNPETTPGNFLAQFIISQPGSYYLSGNIAGVSGKWGIQIEASNVTLDLNGFSLAGVAGALHGIYFPYPTTTNVTVRNGLINGWTGGSGVYHLAAHGIMEHLVVSGNNEGIRVGGASQVRQCTVNASIQHGIAVSGSGSLILENHCAGNNTANSSSFAAIYAFGSRNRIEANQVTGSGPLGYGIYIPAGLTNNVVIRNFVSDQGANSYFIPASQIVGPIITTLGTITNANPWANFSF